MTAPVAPTEATCPYCLGAYEPNRNDAEWCGGSCRTAAYRARAAATHADIEAAASDARRRSSAANATGFRLSPREAYMADLRVRALDGEPVETRAQWEALDALPGGHGRIGLDEATWAELGVRLEEQRQAVRAWLAGQS